MKQFYCSLFDHDLKIVKDVTHHIKEYECSHCKEKFTTSPSGGITPLTAKRKEINAALQGVYLKKEKRKQVSVYS